MFNKNMKQIKYDRNNSGLNTFNENIDDSKK